MRRKHRYGLWFGSVAAATLIAAWGLNAEPGGGSEAEWSQWRGPNRDGVSEETGILKSWPKGGPRVLWRVPGGVGFSAISVSGGRAYTMVAEGKDEFVVCLNASDGKEAWRFRSGANFSDWQGGNGPRSTPTIDGDRVFALSAGGTLYALRAGDGKEVWRQDFGKRFGSEVPYWGYSTSPLVEGDLLLVEAGGGGGKSLIAFDKGSGDVRWSSQSDRPSYASPIAITVGGVRQIVFFTARGAVSVSPTDGRLYWRYPWRTRPEVNAATPVFIPPDRIFVSSGYGMGAAVFKIVESQGEVTVEEAWRNREMKNHFSSSFLYENHLYGFDNAIFKCIEADTGKQKWRQRGFGKGSLIFADGHLIVLGDGGKLALVEATPSGYKEKASARVLNGLCWTAPTLVGGKLYIRDDSEIACLDVKGQI